MRSSSGRNFARQKVVVAVRRCESVDDHHVLHHVRGDEATSTQSLSKRHSGVFFFFFF